VFLSTTRRNHEIQLHPENIIMTFDMLGSRPLATRTLFLANQGTTAVGFLGLAAGYCATVSGSFLPEAPSVLLTSLSVLCLSGILHIVWFSQKGQPYAVAAAVCFLILNAALFHALLNSSGTRDIVALTTEGSEDATKLWVAGAILVLALTLVAWMRRPSIPDELKDIDYGVLEKLQGEALTNEELIKSFGRRVHKVQFFKRQKYIDGPVYILGRDRLNDLGVGNLCFMTVKLSDKSRENVTKFIDRVTNDWRIIEAYSVLGDDYLMKVRLPDETAVVPMAEDFASLTANLTTIHVLKRIHDKHDHIIRFPPAAKVPPKLSISGFVDAKADSTKARDQGTAPTLFAARG
jgi:DNA-binding Lrp family transcriptional regulator